MGYFKTLSILQRRDREASRVGSNKTNIATALKEKPLDYLFPGSMIEPYDMWREEELL